MEKFRRCLAFAAVPQSDQADRIAARVAALEDVPDMRSVLRA
jgi:hypothetical protein